MVQPVPPKSSPSKNNNPHIHSSIIDMALRIPPPPRLVRQVGFYRDRRANMFLKFKICTVAKTKEFVPVNTNSSP